MKQNDLNQLLDYLTMRERALIAFSKNNVAYLKDETDIAVYTAETDDVSPNRMQQIKEKLNQQTKFIADKFSHSLFVIEMSPEHELLTLELKDFFNEGVEPAWGLRTNPHIASVKVTAVFSR